MSMMNVMLRSTHHECRCKLEDLPNLIVAQKDGKPVRMFWMDVVAVLSEDDLKKLMIPNSDFLHDVTIRHKGECWLLEDVVVYNKSKAPIGDLIVVILKPEKCQWLGAEKDALAN